LLGPNLSIIGAIGSGGMAAAIGDLAHLYSRLHFIDDDSGAGAEKN
jgi:hypothetical protein